VGEAKRRGTFNERKLEAMDRQLKERNERKLQMQEKERNLTPEQKDRRKKTLGLLAVMSGMAGALNKK